MKYISNALFAICISITAIAQEAPIKQTISSQPDPQKKLLIAEVACGECKFGMKGKSCELAIKMFGKPIFVDGTNLDDHGDAHAKEGLCNAVRLANVQGEILNNRFKATYFKLITPTTTPPTNKK